MFNCSLAVGLATAVVKDRNLDLTQDKNDSFLSKFVTFLTVRLLTDDNLVGRLIGKGGCHLAAIKKETNTKITIPISVSSRSAAFTNMAYPGQLKWKLERLVIVEGNRDNTTKAAKLMLKRLRHPYERDVDHIAVSCSSLLINKLSAFSKFALCFGSKFYFCARISWAIAFSSQLWLRSSQTISINLTGKGTMKKLHMSRRVNIFRPSLKMERRSSPECVRFLRLLTNSWLWYYAFEIFFMKIIGNLP